MGVGVPALESISRHWWMVFALVGARVAGLTLVAPPLRSLAVPVAVRIGVAAAISIMVTPAQLAKAVDLPDRGVGLAWMVGREAALGAVIGFGISALLAGFQYAGQMISQQTGLGLVELLDPGQEDEGGALGRLYGLVALCVFFLVGGHRMAVGALLASFEAVPLGSGGMPESAVSTLVALAGQSFALAIQVGAPVVVALLLAGVATGFLGRIVPQIHFLVLGLPVRVLLGLGAVGLSLVGIAAVMQEQGVAYVRALRDSLMR